MANEPQELAIPSFAPLTDRPSQPVGREPEPVSEHTQLTDVSTCHSCQKYSNKTIPEFAQRSLRWLH